MLLSILHATSSLSLIGQKRRYFEKEKKIVLPDTRPGLGIPVEAGLQHVHEERVHPLSLEADLVIRIQNGLQLHHRVLDVAERHPAVGQIVEDAAQAPYVRLEADLDAGFRLSRGI